MLPPVTSQGNSQVDLNGNKCAHCEACLESLDKSAKKLKIKETRSEFLDWIFILRQKIKETICEFLHFASLKNTFPFDTIIKVTHWDNFSIQFYAHNILHDKPEKVVNLSY